ncbi:hypothetical protein B0H14DRAFT_3899867 [Mycena olivaceomarginata]|nr:hypothetical protein B0H14DRAFT_3899867 [Mycena olivaceomarginata]
MRCLSTTRAEDQKGRKRIPKPVGGGIPNRLWIIGVEKFLLLCPPPLSPSIHPVPTCATKDAGSRIAHPPRTRSSILAITLPKIFADIEAPDISDPDNPQLIQVPPKFCNNVQRRPALLHNLKKWAAKLVHEMRNNKKEALWEREVEDVLERLEVTIKDMWYKAGTWRVRGFWDP